MPKAEGGIISKNRRKREGNEKDPDLSGDLTIKCPGCGITHEFWLNGWVGKGSFGIFYKLRAKLKGARAPRAARPDNRPGAAKPAEASAAGPPAAGRAPPRPVQSSGPPRPAPASPPRAPAKES